MKLHAPIEITSRLMAGVKVGDGWVSIEFGAPTSDGRVRYRYCIDANGKEFDSDDLKSGVGGGSLQSGLESLLAFLGAAAEAYRYSMRTGQESENNDLFPAWVNEWAYQHEDELAMLQCELEENDSLIED